MSQCRIQILVFTLSYHFSFVMSNLLAPYICNVCAERVGFQFCPCSCTFILFHVLFYRIHVGKVRFLMLDIVFYYIFAAYADADAIVSFFVCMCVFFLYLNYLHKLRCQKIYNRQLSVWICFVHLLIFQTFWLILSSCSLNFKSLPLLLFSLSISVSFSLSLYRCPILSNTQLFLIVI